MFCNRCLFDHVEGECANNAHEAPAELALELEGGAAAPGLVWHRVEFPGTRKASYELHAGGKPTGYAVRWCGHPTALWPYSLEAPGVARLITYRTSTEGKRAAVELYLARDRAPATGPAYQPTRYAAIEHAARVLLESLEWERKRSGTTYHGAEMLREAIARGDA